MKTPHLRLATRLGARSLLLSAMSLSILLAVGLVGPATAYDPASPTSNKDSSDSGGGDPGGGDPGGGDPGGGGNTHKVALGVAIMNGGDMAALDAHTAAVGGNRPALWVLRTSWGGVVPDFPIDAANALRTRGVTPVIWWTPADPADLESPTYSRHKNITRGDHDAYIRSFARGAKAFGGEILLRFAHEVNGGFFPWTVDEYDNTAETFIDMWRHVHDIFEQEGADNVKWVWSLAKEKCSGGCNPFTRFWPGASYVDVMGFTGYNWGDQRTWQSMWQTYKRPMIKLAEISSKPIMVAEGASSPEGGDKAAWIRDGYREVYDAWPQLKAITWTDVDLRASGHPDWRIASPAAALDAYREIASLDRFKGRTLFSAAKKAAVQPKRDTDKTSKSNSTKRKSGPRVEAGTATKSDSDSSQTTSVKTRNKVTKSPTKKDREPPATLDTFSR